MKLDLDALFEPGRAASSGWRRMPAIAGEAMVATSHPLATRAGLRALEHGGNAVDAALAAAALLTVAEPTDNGVGGDAFALVWDGGVLHGINGSGRSPAMLDGGRCRRRRATVGDRARRRAALGRPRREVRAVRSRCTPSARPPTPQPQASPAAPGSRTSGRERPRTLARPRRRGALRAARACADPAPHRRGRA